MCTVLVSYNKRNQTAKALMEVFATMKGVKVRYDYKEKTPKKNRLDMAIEEIKNKNLETYETYEDFENAMRKELGYV